ncbi:hypothetical protein N9O24_00445 [bacterium]|nr:hypothetical protein [bacterium]
MWSSTVEELGVDESIAFWNASHDRSCSPANAILRALSAGRCTGTAIDVPLMAAAGLTSADLTALTEKLARSFSINLPLGFLLNNPTGRQAVIALRRLLESTEPASLNTTALTLNTQRSQYKLRIFFDGPSFHFPPARTAQGWRKFLACCEITNDRALY